MKRLLTLLLVVCAWTTYAQDMRFGLQVAPTFNWLSSNSKIINPNGTNLGLRLTLLGERYLRDNLALTGGLGFHFNAGGQLRYDLTGDIWPDVDYTGTGIPNGANSGRLFTSGTNLRYQIRYFEIPVGLKYRTGDFGDFRGFLEAPILTFQFRGRSKGDVSGNYREEDLDIKPQVVGFNTTWGVGAGLEYAVSDQNSIVAGVYYNQGFFNIAKRNGNFITGYDDKGTTDPSDDTPIFKSIDANAISNNVTIRLAFLF